MSGCFGSSAIDRWMEGQLNDYLDSQEGLPDEIDFDMKLKNSGTIHVVCGVEEEHWQDYDGRGVDVNIKIREATWTFNRDGDADISGYEDEIKERAMEELKEYC